MRTVPSILLRLAIVAFALTGTRPVAAQVRTLPTRDSIMIRSGTPIARLPAGAVAAPAPMGVSGVEIVYGASVEIAALTFVQLSAQCPAGKVAISAGMDLATTGDAIYGVELRGIWTDGDRLGRAFVRNANVITAVSGRAVAVCIPAMTGLRNIKFGGLSLGASDPAQRADQGCQAGERLIGGGVMGSEFSQIAANAPQGSTPDGAMWRLVAVSQNRVVIPGLMVRAEGRAVCAPAVNVDGWSLEESAEVSLAPRGVTTLSVSCPTGKVLLSAGVVQESTNFIDMLANDITYTGTTGATAQVLNRNIDRGAPPVRAKLAAICARRQ